MHDVSVDENCIQTYTQMFTGLFVTSVTAKTWKQSRWPLAGERTHKLWYIQTMERYSELGRNELSSR